MTKIEMFETIRNESSNEDVKQFCETEIKRLKESADRKKKSSAEKKAKENTPIIKKICEFMKGREKYLLASDIAVGCDISTQKAIALLKSMDNIEITTVKVKGKGERKAFKLIEETA